MYRNFFKRLFDLLLSLIGLFFLMPLIIICWLIASIETKSNGFFFQERVGRYCNKFYIIKIKTMHNDYTSERSTIFVKYGYTFSGVYFRKFKFDELPQLFNILVGQMSFVGPRPDVPGFMDMLEGEDALISALRPGITGPASIKYKDEESILSRVADPEHYNKNIIWPDKININLQYLRNHSFKGDIKIILHTIGINF